MFFAAGIGGWLRGIIGSSMHRGKAVRWGPRRGIGISGTGETMELRQTEASEEIFEEAGSSVDHVNAWSIIFIGGKTVSLPESSQSIAVRLASWGVLGRVCAWVGL